MLEVVVGTSGQGVAVGVGAIVGQVAEAFGVVVGLGVFEARGVLGEDVGDPSVAEGDQRVAASLGLTRVDLARPAFEVEDPSLARSVFAQAVLGDGRKR